MRCLAVGSGMGGQQDEQLTWQGTEWIIGRSSKELSQHCLRVHTAAKKPMEATCGYEAQKNSPG